MECRNILDKILNDFNNAISDLNKIKTKDLVNDDIEGVNETCTTKQTDSLNNEKTEITIEDLEKEKQIAIQNLDILKIINLEEQIKNFNN